MLALSQFTKESTFLWIPNGLRPFHCDDLDDPRNQFAKRFHPDCIIPAVRVGLTNSKHPCSYHCDEMNSNLIQYQLIPTFCKIVTHDGVIYRCAVIGCSQRSVDQYLVWAEVHGTYIDFVCEKYEKFNEEGKHVSPALFSTGTLVQTSIPLFEAYRILCNMDPWVHYGSITEWALCLDCNFKLNHPERLSLLRAMAVAPNSANLFMAAASTLLQAGDLNTQDQQKYHFGLLLANLMVDISRALVAEKRQIPPRRYTIAMPHIKFRTNTNGIKIVTGFFF
jgi:hypothetical protein